MYNSCMNIKPVMVNKTMVPQEDWVCPHCQKKIGEKALYHDGTNWQHRECGGKIILPKDDRVLDLKDFKMKNAKAGYQFNVGEPVKFTNPGTGQEGTGIINALNDGGLLNISYMLDSGSTAEVSVSPDMVWPMPIEETGNEAPPAGQANNDQNPGAHLANAYSPQAGPLPDVQQSLKTQAEARPCTVDYQKVIATVANLPPGGTLIIPESDCGMYSSAHIAELLNWKLEESGIYYAKATSETLGDVTITREATQLSEITQSLKSLIQKKAKHYGGFIKDAPTVVDLFGTKFRVEAELPINPPDVFQEENGGEDEADLGGWDDGVKLPDGRFVYFTFKPGVTLTVDWFWEKGEDSPIFGPGETSKSFNSFSLSGPEDPAGYGAGFHTLPGVGAPERGEIPFTELDLLPKLSQLDIPEGWEEFVK